MKHLKHYIAEHLNKFDSFEDELHIRKICANHIIINFPLINKYYYEEYDLEFQFTPLTYKNYAGYFDAWNNTKEWYIKTSSEIEDLFSKYYPEKLI